MKKAHLSARDAALKAVQTLKDGQFKATAIKVELEANIYRGWDESECLQYIVDELGLEGEIDYCDYHDDMQMIQPIGSPIKFMGFYNDGSVDTELTFTVSLDKPENILLLPKVVRIFKDMCTQAGDGHIDVSGAGMHMALLNSSDCVYPSGSTDANRSRFNNFSRSMTILLPALYFLASPNESTRQLGFRLPQVQNEKYSAINYQQGAIEFRIFDTCYDTPDRILDNVIVISKCMKYWRSTYLNPGIDKICSTINFGNDNGHTLERFYYTTTHIDVLDAGLRKLKPGYLTIKELKQQRKFSVNKRKISSKEKEIARDAQREYKEYEERFEWRLKYLFYDYMYTNMGRFTRPVDATKAEAEAEAKAKEQIEAEKQKKQRLPEFIQEKIRSYQSSLSSNYTLRA